MRSALVISGVVVVLACGPIDQSGSPSVGASDAGAAFDGGVASGGGGSADAGVALGGGGVADAGVASGGGAADAGVASGGGGAVDAGSTAAPCDGVLPAALGGEQSATLAHRGGDACWYFTSDLSGNVAGEAHPGSQGDEFSGTWQIFSSGGASRGGFAGVAGDVNGQDVGFESTQRSGATSLLLFGADGRALRSTPLDQGGCRGQAYLSAVGGVLVLDGCGGAVSASRFDAQGNAIVTVQLGKIPSAAGVTDPRGLTLIVVSPGSAAGVKSDHAARWYDAKLAPVTPFFAAPGGAGKVIVRPLIDGGAALQIGGVWTGVAQSGAASFDAPPAWLTAHRNYDLEIIRAGKAYACVPRSGASPHNALDLFSATGASCGSVAFPTEGLSVGPDGTVIGSAGEGGCNMTWWSALLK